MAVDSAVRTRTISSGPPDFITRWLNFSSSSDFQMGREPNTDYHVRLLHYRQKAQAGHEAVMKENADRLLKDKITVKYDKHAEKNNFRRKVEDRVRKKMEEYEAEIERRREKYDVLA